MMHPTTPRSKSRVAGVIFALLVLFGFAVVNLPYRYVELDGVWIGTQPLSQSWSPSDSGLVPVMAGWPFKYRIAYEHLGRIEPRWWSTARVWANALAALAIATAVYAGTQYRRRKLETAADPRRLRRYFDVAIALAIMLIPGSFGGLAMWATWSDRTLARRVAPTGACYLSCQLPELVASRVPNGFGRLLMRVRQIHLDQPGDALVRRTARVPTLVDYHLNQGTYDADSLHRLRFRQHLSGLSITSRKLDESLMQTICQQRWLIRLRLDRTNLDGMLLRHLDSMNGLRLVDLTETPLLLSALGKPAWSQSVRSLQLSRPPRGRSGRLTLDRWPRLSELSVTRRSLDPNPETLELRLSRLPQLSRLTLDRLQNHALIADRLPRLKYISEDLEFVLRKYSIPDVPGATWFSKLELHRVASLSQISCYAPELMSLKISRCPQLRELALAAFTVQPGGHAVLEPIEPAQCQGWIDSLGKGDGPTSLNLRAVPLSSIDLAPLADNGKIRQLGLSHTGVSFEQVESLAQMTQLRHLEVADCPVNSTQLRWLLDQFPRLEYLRANLTDVDRLEITGNKCLKSLGRNRIKDLRHLRVIDAPHLKLGIHLAGAPQRIEIRNAPLLRGLAVEGPWPKEASISGVRKLRWFAAGGDEVDDQLVESLLDCDHLDQLTLAYGSLSRGKLVQLGRLFRLTELALPGAAVDDSVTRHWHGMAQLRQINLDDTNVSAGTLRWLGGIESLRRVSLRRNSFDAAACEALGHLTQLAELNLAGCQVPASAIEPILAKGLIERLDLSQHHLEPELIEALAGCGSLQSLVLNHCDVDESDLRRLLTANPDLSIDLNPLSPDLAPALVAELDMRRRRRLNSRGSRLAWVVGFEVAFSLATSDQTANRDSGSERDSTNASQSRVRPQRVVAGNIDVTRFRP